MFARKIAASKRKIFINFDTDPDFDLLIGRN